ncbi:substrate-binding periplasmic protein [Thalassotalea hakodatensis]|uniref:substrate-binding periplasmic protein n=1 Tax=Thalassotalea hakodatensis TaxID=3030492 RepID=UPI0025743990|nr:transporter substrate-binding domain-containing protein [Thalassotalea hakodatensis]
MSINKNIALKLKIKIKARINSELVSFKTLMSHYLLVMVLLVYTVPVSSASLPPTIINVAAIDWCPQICPNNSSKPGYIVEILKLVFDGENIELKIDNYPWSRAIMYVKDGKYMALLSPAKKEAPDLAYPNTPIGIQKMCFYKLKQSLWTYSGLDSLEGVQIGIATDTSIPELKNYIIKNPYQFQSQSYHDRYIKQNIGKLIKERIDTFIFTRNSTKLEVSRLGLSEKIVEAGCISEEGVYLAFSPVQAKRKTVNRLVKLFDRKLKKLIDENKIDPILEDYQTEFLGHNLIGHKALIK